MAAPARVGVIVPVGPARGWLGEALASVLGQDPAAGQVVVVDDGAPEPLVLAPEHAARCRLVRRERPGGPAAARESGLAALEGADLVALCDADDAWEAGKLAAQLEALTRDPGAAVCFGHAVAVDAEGRPTGEPLPAAAAGSWAGSALIDLLWERQPIPASTALIARAALEAAGGFAGPDPLASDWDLWLRLAARGERFVCEPAARVRYRRHGGGVTADLAALAEASLAIHEAHGDLVDPERRRTALAADLRALARGEVHRRRYAHARTALARAAALTPPTARDRALRPLLAVPGIRALAGRRRSYRAAAS